MSSLHGFILHAYTKPEKSDDFEVRMIDMLSPSCANR